MRNAIDIKLKYSIKRILTEEDFVNILDTAFEGGIGYWACLRNDLPEWKAAEKRLNATKPGGRPTYGEVAMDVLKAGDVVTFQDAEDTEDGDCWELCASQLMAGAAAFQKDASEYADAAGGKPYDLASAVRDGDFDSDDADKLVQLALFNVVMFG